VRTYRVRQLVEVPRRRPGPPHFASLHSPQRRAHESSELELVQVQCLAGEGEEERERRGHERGSSRREGRMGRWVAGSVRCAPPSMATLAGHVEGDPPHASTLAGHTRRSPPPMTSLAGHTRCAPPQTRTWAGCS
jgi:hypothetical protein